MKAFSLLCEFNQPSHCIHRLRSILKDTFWSLFLCRRQVLASIVNLTLALTAVIWLLPSFIFVTIGIGYIYYCVFFAFRNTSRDLRRLESVLRSPIFSSFAELLDGVVSVRAYGEEQRFLIIFTKRLDRATAAYHYFWNRWVQLSPSTYCTCWCSPNPFFYCSAYQARAGWWFATTWLDRRRLSSLLFLPSLAMYRLGSQA